MTLKYAQGFETVLDDSDIRAQGWLLSGTAQRVTTVPSVTSIAGRSLALIGPITGSAAQQPGNAGAGDAGYVYLGTTVNQAWTAGGFTFGHAAKFNNLSNAFYGGPTSTLALGITPVFDGTLYWAFQTVGAAVNIATSPDLVNWTVTPSQPAAFTSFPSIQFMGSGIIMVVPGVATATTLTVYYTTNNGASWSSQVMPGTQTSAASYGFGFPTGNGTNPHVVCGGAGSQNIWVGTLGGTMTQVVTGALASSAGVYGRVTKNGNILMFSFANNVGVPAKVMSLDVTASLTTAASYNTVTPSGFGTFYGTAYHPTSNLWVCATSNGICTFPNTGAAGTPVAPTGSVTTTFRYSAGATYGVYWNGTAMFAHGANGVLITSPDGIAWTATAPHIWPQATAGLSWYYSLYDGSKYVLFSDSATGVIATTPDGVNNYQATFVSEFTESTGQWYNSTGIIASTTVPTSGGAWTVATSMVIVAGAVSSGSRTITLFNNSTSIATFTMTADMVAHYHEITATKDPANGNKFFITWSIDGVQVFSSGATSYLIGSSATDTTSVLVTSLCRTRNWTRFDDMYFTINDAVANTTQGPTGPINIVALRPSTDVQAQWTKSGSAASNALTVRATALSNSTGSVSTSVDGSKDLYATADTVPANYKVRAAYVEGYFARTSSTNPAVSIGLQSGSSEVDSPTTGITSTSYAYLNQIIERDPNGTINWTPTSIQAAKLAITKVS